MVYNLQIHHQSGNVHTDPNNMEAFQGDTSTGNDDRMEIIVFISCLVILLFSLLGVIGVIVLYYKMDCRRRQIMRSKYQAAKSSIINQGNQQLHV